MNTEIYDAIVVGGGVSGAAAAMYCARFNLKTLGFATLPGGLITTTHMVENYPGIKQITGPAMGQVFLEHAMETGAEYNFSTVTKIEKKDDVFVIIASGKEFQSRTVIYSTGTEHKHLGVPGEEEFKNKGVSYCALCDAAFFKEKTVAVVGGGDTAAIDANILAQHCKKVYVLVRKDFMRAEPTNQDRIEADPKVEICYETEIAEICGEDKMTHVILKDGSRMDLDGVFIAIGWNTNSALAQDLGVELNARNEVIITRQSETNIAGFFAAGDVTDAKFKQAIIGAGEGVYASVMAYDYIQKNFR